METEQPQWRPLTESQRRIIGVLVEKAKTTPEQYPLSLNSLTTGCNQKSNRSPLMQLDAEDVQVDLDELRDMGAVVEIQSGGRVAKFKHRMYEWLGVEKTELAVVAELLLRGEQTIGELRGRAARMEPIPDLGSLRPVLASLVEKQLVVELTPAGRGQVVTHGLLTSEELAAVKSAPRPEATSAPPPTPRSAAGPSRSTELEDLRGQVKQLAERVQRLEDRLGGDSPPE